MKNSKTKKAIEKFSSRNVHKRRGKEKAKRELMRAVMETNVNAESVKLSVALDRGRRGRVSPAVMRDEILARGVFSASKSGYGFVSLLECEEERDVFIPEDKTLGAIDGDLVEIIYHKYKSRFGEEKTEGRVKKIVEFGRRTVIGTVSDDGFLYQRKKGRRNILLLPDDSKINLMPKILNPEEAEIGDKVLVKLIRGNGRFIDAEILSNFGNTYSKKANYEAILAESEIPLEFSKEALAEAEFFSSAPISDEGRVDRRGEIIFTIDGKGAKDLDDAVSLKKLKGGEWQLGVHIADVSYYVRERGHLDRAVMARGTSVYFTDKVVPMLPPAISNGAASLNMGEDKLAMSAIIRLSASGEIISVRLEPTVIKSRMRGVYEEVNEIYSGKASSEILKKYKEVIPTLKKMHELYLVLKQKSEGRGALSLESSEAEIVLDKDGIPIDIIKRERGDAEMLIEQFMLTANEAVAKYLSDKKVPCVYRIHENPPPEKLSELLTFSKNLGLDISGISTEAVESGELTRLLSEARKKGIATPLSYTMLRSMAKAKYSDVRAPHFGLGIEYYCHFTSPIRRLSDLATHRIIRRVLFEGKRPELYASYAKRAAAAASDAELRAMAAERRIENLYKVIYMERFIGRSFRAFINSVTSFGFFAELENTVEGLVPISELPGVFTYDENNISLRSRDVIYRIGDEVTVVLEEADIIRGKLRFSVV
jgi:ribonuclease R